MVDRGFNGVAPLLLQVGMHYVAPPSTRGGEEQFTGEDAGVTRDVANLRIHVEREGIWSDAAMAYSGHDVRFSADGPDWGGCVRLCGAGEPYAQAVCIRRLSAMWIRFL